MTPDEADTFRNLHTDHLNGESVLAISRRTGISRPAIYRHWNALGLQCRGRSEAGLVRASQMTPEQRQHQSAAAHEAVKQKPKNVISPEEYRRRRADRQRRARAKYPEKFRERSRRHYARHKEQAAKTNRRWLEEHAEQRRQSRRIWFAAHPEQRARKWRGSDGHYGAADIAHLIKLQHGKCGTCKAILAETGFHVDHVMPISLGGTSNPENLQLLCPPCNRRKRAKHPDDWAKENGQLFC